SSPLTSYAAAYAFVMLSLGGTLPSLCRHSVTSWMSLEPPVVKIESGFGSAMTPVFTIESPPPPRSTLSQSSRVSENALPSSSNTLLCTACCKVPAPGSVLEHPAVMGRAERHTDASAMSAFPLLRNIGFQSPCCRRAARRRCRHYSYQPRGSRF